MGVIHVWIPKSVQSLNFWAARQDKIVVDDLNIVGCSKTQLSLNFSITGIYNNLHSKCVPEHSAANYHH